MATAREVKTLSNPYIYVDGKLVKIISNSGKVEYMAEVKSRTVSHGGGQTSVVHGFDASTDLVKVSFSLAHTKENVEFVRTYKARAKAIQLSTIKTTEDGDEEIIPEAVMTDAITRNYEAEGDLECVFMGRNSAF